MLMNLLFGSVFSSTLQAQVHREYLPAVENKSMRSSSATLLPLSFDSNRTTDEPTSGASVYENAQYGIGIQYPFNWSYREYDPSSDLLAFNVVSFFPPITPDPDLSSELRITIENLNTPISLDQYSRDSVNYYRNNNQNFSLISLTTTDETLSGRPAYEMVYSEEVDGVDRTSYEKGTIDAENDRVYYLTFTSPTPMFSQLIPIVDSMVDTFTLNLDGDARMMDEGQDLLPLFPGDSFSGSDENQGAPEDLEGQDVELFMNAFANSIFNGSSVFAAFGSSMVDGIKVTGINLSEEDSNELSGNMSPNKQLSVTLSGSPANLQTGRGNSSVTVIAARIPVDISSMFSPEGLLGLAAATESSDGDRPPFVGGEFDGLMGMPFQEGSPNPFGFLSMFQIGSSSLVNPDWAVPQTVSMSLLGKPDNVTGTSTPQSSNLSSSVDIIVTTVIPYTGMP